jgi:ligand-binding sensor domain-containing protein/tRNA A-37 threonylcarbamoyl transferase component Bud32
MGKFRLANRCCALCLVLAGLGNLALGQQYPFLAVPGAPKGVTVLFQDSKGRLWLGGSQQVVCFDGARFFSLADYGMPPTVPNDIAEDSGGAIWIGADTGVYRFATGSVERVRGGSAVSVIPATPEVAIVAAGQPGRNTRSQGFVSLDRVERINGKWRSDHLINLDSAGPLTRDPTGMILYPRPGKGWGEIRMSDLLHPRPGAAIPITQEAVRGFPGGPLKILRDRFGCVWEGASGDNIYNCGGGRTPVKSQGSEFQENLHEAPDGNMVLWSYDALALGRPGSIRFATIANGLAGPQDAIAARDGTVWIGNAEGLYRFASPFRVEYWAPRDGISAVPWSIARSGGRIYAGLGRGIVVLDEDRLRWKPFSALSTSLAGLLGADDGRLLASFKNGGAVELDANGRELARTGKDCPLRSSMRLTRTPDGEVWVGGSLLGRLSRQGNVLSFENHALQASPSRDVLSVKYEEHTRKLWACYNGGVAVRDENGAWREIATRDGLLANGCWSLAPLPSGDVWDAYFGINALALIRPNASGGVTIRQYRPSDGIPEPGSQTMDTDKRGWLWRSGDQGIYVADTAEAEAGQWLKLDQSDGLPANDMNSGSVFVDDDGSLWWGADNDLAHYSPPPDLVRPKFAPQVFVSAFSWDNKPPRLAEAVANLPHGSSITVHIGSLQFDRRNALRIRYRLLPDQSQWRESGKLDVSLGALATGSHTLEVQGRVFTGPWSTTERRSFMVMHPILLTWPFLVSDFVAANGLAALGYLLYRRRKIERAMLLPNLAAFRMSALLPEVYELTGTVLDGNFEVGELLARGGFAAVFSGYDRGQNRQCAVKVFRGELKNKDWAQRRFAQEVEALRRVRHRNVVSIYAHGCAPTGAPYLVMEFVEGKNLREILEEGPLAPKRTAQLLRQLAAALDAIHAQNICHRDVKPENVIIRQAGSPNEEAVLIDFSIAIVKDANETLHGLSRAAGSFDYMAPEQAVGYAEPSSDIYSLAKLLIEMLTGRQLKDLLPDAALDLPERVRDLLQHLTVRLSPESIHLVATALEFDPAKRPRVAGLFAQPIVGDLESDAGAGQI